MDKMDIDGDRLLDRIGVDGVRHALRCSFAPDRLVELATLCGLEAHRPMTSVIGALAKEFSETRASRLLLMNALVAANKEVIDRLHSMPWDAIDRALPALDDRDAGRTLFVIGIDDREPALAAIDRLWLRLAASEKPPLQAASPESEPMAPIELLRQEVRELRRQLDSADARLTKATAELTADMKSIASEMARRGQSEASDRPHARSDERSTGRREQDRVGLFVDVQNMYYAARQLNARLDFGALMAAASRERRLVRAIAYVVQSRDIDQSGFLTMLQQKRYSVRLKDLKIRHDGSSKGDWDMEIALEILRMAEHLDVVALVSGDGDFTSLVTQVRTLGPKVEVYSFTGSTAMELIQAADRHIPIDESFLIRTPPTS